MTGDLAVRNGGPRNTAITEWDYDYRDLVKSQILRPEKRDASDQELMLFAEHCVRTGLDPMAKQIYGIFRYSKRTNREEMTIQVGIDGLRALAERTGRYAGGPAYEFCGADKVWTDVWEQDARPFAAKAVVLKVVGGTVIETSAVALWSEYGATKNVWASKPAHMLGKCAEALALRKAFPADLSGLHTDDEMASQDKPVIAPATPQVEAGEPVEFVSDEQFATLLTGAELLAEHDVKAGPILVAHGATRGPDLESTIRSLPASEAEAVGKALSDKLDQVAIPAEAEVVE